MTREPLIQKDGFTSLIGGMNSAVEPPLLNANEAATLINVTVRNGYAQTRPGFMSIALTYSDSEMQDWIETHHIQGSEFYVPKGELPYLLVMVAGRLTRWNVNGYISELTPTVGTTLTAPITTPPVGMEAVFAMTDVSRLRIGYPVFIASGKYKAMSVSGQNVTLLNISDQAGVLLDTGTAVNLSDPSNPEQEQAWLEQADHWMFVQDGESPPIIYDGVKAVRAEPTAMQMPTGTVMKYYPSIGRIAVAIGSAVALSDINSEASDLRFFKEEHLLQGGGRFKVPQQYGPITALINLSTLDSTLGRGSLLVGTANAIFALNLPPERSTWPQIENLQTVALMTYGPKAQSSTVLANSDVFFRAEDGIYSLIAARRDFGTWGNTPVSAEIQRLLNQDDSRLLRFSSAIIFDNRLLMTVAPLPRNPYGWYHRGMVALDFNPISTMRGKSAPAYDGLWTGIKPVVLNKTMVDNQERAFVIALEGTGYRFWEISRDGDFDGDGGRIECVAETRAFKALNEFEMKRLCAAELWWDQVVGNVNVDVKYRPDQYPCWFNWEQKEMCSTAQDCQSDDVCQASVTFESGYKTRMPLRSPTPACETADGKPSDCGYNFQIRIQWIGHARLKKMLLKCQTLVEDAVAYG